MTDSPVDFQTKTVKQLRAHLKTRRVPLTGLRLKAQLVSAAQEDHVRKSKADEELEQENIKKAKLEHEELLVQVQVRGLEVEGTTLEELRQAVHDDGERITKEKERKERVERQVKIQASRIRLYNDLFNRSFTADPSRKSFTDLPREIRDMVYTHLFSHPSVTDGVIKIRYDPERDRFFNGAYGMCFTPGLRPILAALLTLGTLNKGIRAEARAAFWSLAAFTLEPEVGSHLYARESYTACTPHYISVLERFLRGLGDAGRYGIKTLMAVNCTGCRCCGHLIPLDYSAAGAASFTRTLDLLGTCTTLTELRLTVSEHYLFHGEQGALEAFFLAGRDLRSNGVEKLQDVLRSLPHLRNADIDVLEEQRVDTQVHGGVLPAVPWAHVAPFMRWAFTGLRRVKLMVTVKAILQATELQHQHGRITVRYRRNALSTERGARLERLNPDAGWEERVAWVLAECEEGMGTYEAWLEE